MKKAKPTMYYSAEGSRRNGWTGWAQYPPAAVERVGQIVKTPQQFRTKAEAIAAIKAQHP